MCNVVTLIIWTASVSSLAMTVLRLATLCSRQLSAWLPSLLHWQFDLSRLSPSIFLNTFSKQKLNRIVPTSPEYTGKTIGLSLYVLHHPHEVIIFTVVSGLRPGLCLGLYLGLHSPGKRQSPERGLCGPGRPGRHPDRGRDVLLLRGGVAVGEVVILQLSRQRRLEGSLDSPHWRQATLERRLPDVWVDLLISLDPSIHWVSSLDDGSLQFSDPALHLGKCLGREIVSALIKVPPLLWQQKEDIISFLLVW